MVIWKVDERPSGVQLRLRVVRGRHFINKATKMVAYSDNSEIL